MELTNLDEESLNEILEDIKYDEMKSNKQDLYNNLL